jgi:hypothetical protein
MVLFSLARKGKSDSVKKCFSVESPLVVFLLSHFQGLVPSLQEKKLNNITIVKHHKIESQISSNKQLFPDSTNAIIKQVSLLYPCDSNS